MYFEEGKIEHKQQLVIQQPRCISKGEVLTTWFYFYFLSNLRSLHPGYEHMIHTESKISSLGDSNHNIQFSLILMIHIHSIPMIHLVYIHSLYIVFIEGYGVQKLKLSYITVGFSGKEFFIVCKIGQKAWSVFYDLFRSNDVML